MTLQNGPSLVIPADGVWFDLEVNDDVVVVASAGYDPRGWKYLGPKLTGKKKLQVKLVRFGYVRNLKEAEKKADAMGCRLVEGQAREAFKAKFPKPDDNDPVIFGGSRWLSPYDDAYMACLLNLREEWISSFYPVDSGFDGHWLWLVVAK